MPDIGYYSNIFPVELNNTTLEILIADRKNFQDLRSIRDEIEKGKKDVFVYAHEDKVYGYGKDLHWLTSKGFTHTKINLYDVPHLTGRMILEGFINNLNDNGYTPIMGKGRCRLFKWNSFKVTSDGKVRVHRGLDIRSIFLLDRRSEELVFGIVVDIIYSLRDVNNNRLNSHEVVSKYGRKTFREIRQIQGDLIPTGINKEISRQRFVEEILPFVEDFTTFHLSCGIEAKMKKEPLRVILGGESEPI